MTETARASKMTFAIPNGITSVKMGKKSKLDTKTEGNFFAIKQILAAIFIAEKKKHQTANRCIKNSPEPPRLPAINV